MGGVEVVGGDGIVLCGAVGHDVGRAGLDRDRRREGADLPARFASRGGDDNGPEQDARGVPQVQDARVGVARVRRATEVAQLGDGPAAFAVNLMPSSYSFGSVVSVVVGSSTESNTFDRPFSARSVTMTVIAWVTAGAMPSLTLTVRS